MSFGSVPPQCNGALLSVKVRVEEQFTDIFIRPDVIVDAVINLQETIRLVNEVPMSRMRVLERALPTGMRAFIERRWIRILVDKALQRSAFGIRHLRARSWKLMRRLGSLEGVALTPFERKHVTPVTGL